ncbi:MAG: hypothetical protein KF912_05930 [Phycisphaeraceae bacterium]|nr:hypothetical protein [Phycisphaeraceae bacterium]
MSDAARIVEQIADGLISAEIALAEEQALRGLDMLDETEIHVHIADSLAAYGWGVLREVAYPTPPHPRARRSLRERCDLVLTPSPGQHIIDAVERAARLEKQSATLFASIEDTAHHDDGEIDPSVAIWLELKTTGEFVCRDGIGGPNQSYSSEVVRGPATDLRKLASDATIERAIATLILFASDETVARHDIDRAAHSMLDRGLPLGSLEVATLKIADRIGNRCCCVTGFACARNLLNG